jgi:hypothetical protein
MRASYCFAATLLLAAHFAGAQEFRATITGQVTDPSGAAVPGASISAVSLETRQAYTAHTDAAGEYSLLYLLPGKYTVTVEAPRFLKTIYNVVLESARKVSLNVPLALGSVNQQVVVPADVGLLDTVSSSSGGVVDQAKVENMPSTGREVWQDLAFTQGVRFLATDPFDTTPRNNGDTFAVSGAPSNTNAFFLNGAPVSDSGKWYFTPNQDAVQELQGSVNPYDAQYGRAAGGSFNVNVKSGSNRLHGAVYDYYGNEALNANFYQSNLYGIPNGLNIRNTFGGVVGGPVRKNKTFFFGSYEGFRQNYPSPAVDSVPPLAWRQGDFSQSGYTIYDPLTTACVKTNTSGQCSQYGRQAFPGDVIPADRISPIGKAILGMYPSPTAPGATNNYAISGARNFGYDQYIARLDHNFSENTRLYAMFTTQKNFALSSPGNGFPNAATTAQNQTGHDYNAIVDLTRVITPALVADVRASFGRYSAITVTGAALAQNFTADKLGFTMPVVPTTTYRNVVPTFTVDAMTALFGNTSNGTANNDWDVSASLSQLKRRHNLHYGFEAMDVQTGSIGIPGSPNGSFSFGANWTQNNPLTRGASDGAGVADVLLGYPTSGSADWNSQQFVSYHYYGLYAQDDFKVRSNLTLNFGLRWDVNTSPRERYNRINAGFCFACSNPYTSQIKYSGFPGLQNPLLGGLLFAGVGGVASAPFRTQWHDWQPRIGFSWNFAPKTILRGGYGIYYSFGLLATDSQGFSQTTPYIASLDGSLTPTPYFLSGRPYPNGVIEPSGSNAGLATLAGQGITFNSPTRRIPMTQHWSLGIQRELPKGVLLDIQYIGSHTHAISVSTAYDVVGSAMQQQCFQDNAVCNTNVANPFSGVLPTATTLGAASTIPQWELVRAYPLFNGVTQSDNPEGTSDYHSLNLRVERKLASVDFVVNYVYSNWMDQNSFLNNGNFRDATLWRGLDSNDRRHNLNANLVWPLPVGQGGLVLRDAKGVLGAVVNHWLVDSAILWGTGTPLGIPSADFYGPGCTSYVPGGGQTAAHWLNNNVSCYHNLLAWEPRTSPLTVGYLRNPGFFWWDPSIQKRFALPREGMFVQFRMEAVNGANHPLFGGPSLANNTPPSLTPWVGWVGFGTLPLSQTGTPRAVIASLKILF